MIFELDNVELSYAEKRVLSGVYLKAETGKITCLLGLNGSGKSSLLQIFFGSLKSKYKLLRINGKPQQKSFFKSGIVQYLPQNIFLPEHLTISKIFSLYKLDWKNFLHAFPEFSKVENFKIHELSGGQIRCIETYLIIKSSSKIILLDEPFTNLAPLYIERFKKLIEQEKQAKAIVATDHMYEHILDIADDLYLLKNGCTTFIENPKQLEDYKYLSVGSI